LKMGWLILQLRVSAHQSEAFALKKGKRTNLTLQVGAARR